MSWSYFRKCLPTAKMRRAKLKTKAIMLAGLAAVLWLFILNQGSVNWEAAQLNATKIILKAIGPRNISASLAVLPDKSTILLQAPKACEENGRSIFALFVVNSSPENRERRNAIRKGWSSVVNVGMTPQDGYNKVVFFTGAPTDDELLRELGKEWEEEGDLVVDDINDTYFNLTLKVLRILKWKLQYCKLSKYLVKIDDDVHLQVFRYLTHLKSYSGSEARNLIAGHVYNGTNPIRNPLSKWFIPDILFSAEKLPVFVSGICYALGIDAVPKIYQESLQHPVFHLEDVFLTGMIAGDILKMKHNHIPSVAIYWAPSYNFVTPACTFYKNYVIIHSVRASDILCWNKFNRKDFACGPWPISFYC